MKIEEANHILKTFYENQKSLKGNADAIKAFTKAKKVFTQHYRGKPQAFIEDFIRILHGKTNMECAFHLNAAQQSLVEALGSHRFVAAPKARQLGITTLTNALALHHSLFAMNANVICMAYKADNAQENLRRIKTMFKLMPDWVRWLVQDWNENDGHQNNTSLWSFKSKITGTNNKLEVSSASSADATRGKTPTFLHWTETAFSEIAEEIFTSVFPALNRRKDSVIVLESTGNGNAGFYYEVCVGIRKGFEVVFMPWYLDDDYREEGEKLSIEDRYYIAELMGVDEVPEHLTDDQLRWYQTTSHAIGKAKGQQEYPINVEQVFQATNSSFFSVKTTSKIKIKEPLHALTYENGYLTSRPAGPGSVYAQPHHEFEYILSVDSSEGSIDPSVIIILDPDGNEVLFWREKIVPEDLVELIDALGKRYNMAKVVVENNGVGFYVVSNLLQRMMYPNVYYHEGKPGIKTSVATKPTMLATLQDYIMSDKLHFCNSVLATEMSTFEADTLRATKGQHDDVVMAAAIAAFVFRLDKPKRKWVEERFSDYTNDVYGSQAPRRRFII